LDQAGIDVILVGDSASNVMAGYETTLPITLDNMIYHAASVVRATSRALVVVDLPFGTYQGNSKEALVSAIRIMKETGASAIKVEGGVEIKESIERILSAGIPVMGHLGLTPQAIHKFGTYVVRATEKEEAEKLKSDASTCPDRLFCHCSGEDPGLPCGGGDRIHQHSHHWHRGRVDVGTGACAARHAWHYPGIFAAFPAALPQPADGDQRVP
jgi:hypothetical protein